MRLKRTILWLIIIGFQVTLINAKRYAEIPGLGIESLEGAKIIDKSNVSEADRKSALDMIRHDANNGNPAAAYLAGVIYTQMSNQYEPFFGIILDEYHSEIDGYSSYSSYKFDQAVYYYELAASQNYLPALNNLGYLYASQPKTSSKALDVYLKAANMGSEAACANLGREYFFGGNIVSYDYKEAVKWLTKALQLGNQDDETYLYLGYCYEKGHGVSKDFHKAVELYTMAHDNSKLLNYFGRSIKTFSIPIRLAILYYNVEEVRNYNQAFKYLQFVADQPSLPMNDITGYILRCLSACYRAGRGTPVNIAKADYYLKQAADYGNVEAKEALQMLDSFFK